MKNSYRKDIGYNVAGNALPLMVAIFTIPNLISSLKAETFGLITLIWALIGYFGIFDLGIGRALTYEVRMALTSGRNDNIAPIIKSGVIVALLTGLGGALLIGLVVAPNAGEWFKISQDTYQIEKVFQLIALSILPTTFFSCLRGTLEAFGNFYEVNFARMLIGSMMFIIPYLEVKLGSGNLMYIAGWLALMRFVVLAMTVYWLREHLFDRRKAQFKHASRLLNFGIWVATSSIISPLMVYGDRFIVSGIMGAAEIVFYAVPQEGIQRLLLIPGAVTAALLPRIIGSIGKNFIESLYSDSKKKVAVLMAAVCALCAVIGYPALSLWLSPAFASKAYLITLILLIGIWFNSLAQFPINLLIAKALPKIVAIAHAAELIFYVIILYVFTKMIGLEGAAIAWTTRAIIDYYILDHFAKREIRSIPS
jgi:O-antigen/teichoic acid export membrane protein